MLDKLVSFIKSERQCCNFFHFGLDILNEKDFIMLEISGPEGAKEFIKAELGL